MMIMIKNGKQILPTASPAGLTCDSSTRIFLWYIILEGNDGFLVADGFGGSLGVTHFQVRENPVPCHTSRTREPLVVFLLIRRQSQDNCREGWRQEGEVT